MSTFNDPQTLWRTVQNELRRTLSQNDFQNWFANIRCTGGDTALLDLEAPTDFAELWVNRNYHDLLVRNISLAAGRPMDYRLAPPVQTSAQDAADAGTAGAGVAGTAGTAGGGSRSHRRGEDEPPPPPAIKRDNTFENFIVGEENQLAHAASLAVSNEPGHVYNPLFIYGASGHGKTHLLHAIAHAVLNDSMIRRRIIYVTSEKFTNDYIEAVRENTLSEFRKYYRAADVLLVDDVQFLANKEKTQDEFFHLFNELHMGHRQIVLASDRAPRELNGLEQRLVSRFSWGLTADIGAPRLETRIAILQKKAGIAGIHLADDVVTFLATRIISSVRNLEGAVMRLKAMTQMGLRGDSEITVARVERELAGLLHEEAQDKITPEIIKRVVADYYRIEEAEMNGRKRTADVAFARQVAMYLCTQHTALPLTAIGAAFGGRDHGTVIHARKMVQNRCSVEPAVKSEVDYIDNRLATPH